MHTYGLKMTSTPQSSKREEVVDGIYNQQRDGGGGYGGELRGQGFAYAQEGGGREAAGEVAG